MILNIIIAHQKTNPFIQQCRNGQLHTSKRNGRSNGYVGFDQAFGNAFGFGFRQIRQSISMANGSFTFQLWVFKYSIEQIMYGLHARIAYFVQMNINTFPLIQSKLHHKI